MRDTFGRADGDVLTGVERAAHTGRRITARRARRQKRSQQSARGWSIGSLTVTPVLALGVAVLVLAGAAGAAVALGGGKDAAPKESGSATPARPISSSTHPPTTAAPAVKGIFIRYTDAAAVVHYMYCTKAAGCGMLDVAKDGTSKMAVTSLAGVWHREQRVVIKHDPCIDIVENAVQIGQPGDLARVTTTDLHRVGTQTIKGIPAPARIVGTVAVRYEYPHVSNCTFSGMPDYTQRVDSPVTEYVPT